ncbi:HK97 gp10 family phage protein [Paenibacillus hexagrammi]|uniref:HK97 gp10 family phage protein n=1 Tax=Paenibacillus hexagrammi TaxID=2908839 RepID=A0ABY3SRH6_9BACL|nr:HK97 gp10 family phage protein [Paenibacillus sp. YPD9-1]UJF36633.1 hypothetical protein L0M14_30555 [Paenibacillus sp. YPD9-1]
MPLNFDFEDFGFIKNVQELPVIVERETTNLLVDMAIWIKADLKKQVPVKTGNLRSSVRYELKDGYEKDASFFSVDYGKWIDEGTGVYGPSGKRIRPATKKAMYWKAENKFMSSIAGIKPRKFTQKTFRGALREVDPLIDSAASRIFRDVIGR